MDKSIMTDAMSPVMRISWLADSLAFSLSSCPRYWEATTAPPVDTAANTLIIRLLIMSTKDTPDVAASPALETIMVSAMPTVTARICSTIRGAIRRIRSRLVNRYRFRCCIVVRFFLI